MVYYSPREWRKRKMMMRMKQRECVNGKSGGHKEREGERENDRSKGEKECK